MADVDAAPARDRRADHRQPRPRRLPGRHARGDPRRWASRRATATAPLLPLEEVERGARASCSSFDPPGVACRDLRESLLRQLDAPGGRPRTPGPPHGAARHWDLFLRRQFPALAKKLDVELRRARAGGRADPHAGDPPRPQVLDRARRTTSSPTCSCARSATSTSSSSTTTACRGCGSSRAYRRMLQTMRSREAGRPRRSSSSRTRCARRSG